MKKILTVLSIAFLATSAYAKTYTVERVISGDIIKLTNGKIVRLLGIDTPESEFDVEAIGISLQMIKQIEQEAKEYLADYISRLPNKEVYLEFDVEKKDKYSRSGRWQAYVFWDTGHVKHGPMDVMVEYNQYFDYYGDAYRHFINATMVKAGYAVPMHYKPNVKYKELFEELHIEAKDHMRGLWSESQQSPDEVKVEPLIQEVQEKSEESDITEVLKKEIEKEYAKEELEEESIQEEVAIEQVKEEIAEILPEEVGEKESPKEDLSEDLEEEPIQEEVLVEQAKEEIIEIPLEEEGEKINLKEELLEEPIPMQLAKMIPKEEGEPSAREPAREEKEFYDNGVLRLHMAIYNEENYEGFWREYYTNGKLKVDAKLLMVEGGCGNEDVIPIEGLAREFHINGQLKQFGEYKNNCEEGIHRHYSYEGLLEEELYYERGRHLWTKWYNENGRVVSEEFYDNVIIDTISN